jgi:hypothetical protein
VNKEGNATLVGKLDKSAVTPFYMIVTKNGPIVGVKARSYVVAQDMVSGKTLSLSPEEK